MDTRAKRNSSIELLKIIAIVMVVFSHGMPNGSPEVNASAIEIGRASTDIQMFVIRLLYNLGQIGNCIFIVCTSWFLLESKSAKFNKIMALIGDCFVISMIMLVLFTLLGYRLPMLDFIQQFLPVTFGNSWFLTCYLLFYAAHPLLNIVLEHLSQKGLLLVDTVFVILYCCMSFVTAGKLFFYSEIIGFCGVYFIVAYVKKYLKKMTQSMKTGVVLLVIGIVGWLLENVVLTVLGVRISLLARGAVLCNNFINPCFLLIAIGSFVVAKNIQFSNKAVNYVSGLSLLIYLFHCNRIVRDYVRFDFFEYVLKNFTYDRLLGWVILFALISLAGGILLAVLYNLTVQKLVRKLCYKVAEWLEVVFSKIAEFVMRLE